MGVRSWWTVAWATLSVAVLGWALLGHLAAREPLQHHFDEALLVAVIVLNLPESAVLALLMTLSLWVLGAAVGMNVPGGVAFLVFVWLAFTALGARRHLRAWRQERAAQA